MSSYKVVDITEKEMEEIDRITDLPHDQWDWNSIYGGEEAMDYKIVNLDKAVERIEEQEDNKDDWEPMDWETDDTLDMPPEQNNRYKEWIESGFDSIEDEFEDLQDFYDDEAVTEKESRRTDREDGRRFYRRRGEEIDWFGDEGENEE